MAFAPFGVCWFPGSNSMEYKICVVAIFIWYLLFHYSYSMCFVTSLASRFRRGEIADHIANKNLLCRINICDPFYRILTLWVLRVHWEQIPGRGGSRPYLIKICLAVTTFVIHSTEYLLYGFCVLWEQVPRRWGSRSCILKICLVVTTFVISSTEFLLYGFCVPWEQVPGRWGSRPYSNQKSTSLWRHLWSVLTEYLIYEICVP